MNTLSMKNTRGVVRLLAGLAIACLAGWAQAEPVGEVLFTIGNVQLASGEPLARGARIEKGQVLVTGSNGHVHIRFVDQAFVSVRPDSRLRVDEYIYDLQAPQNNRVKFTLETGTSRLITGKAGQENKEGFRLNTPMAAIGVRGTDFVVATSAENTRVTVQQGAVVLSPLGDGCAAETFGPCGGSLSRQLTGSLTGSYLELSGAGRAPILRSPEEGSQNPNRLMPPRPEEPGSNSARASDTQHTVAGHAAAAPQIWWGRWGDATNGDLTPGNGREVIARGDLFVLMRSTDNLTFPSRNTVKFNLADSETYLRNASGTYLPATVNESSLTVDFGARQFKTALSLEQGGKNYAVAAQGGITSTGRFRADAGRSNAILSGALSDGGNQAAYFFQKSLGADGRLLGITRWTR